MEVAAGPHTTRGRVLSTGVDGHNHCHPLEEVLLYVAMEEPVAGVVRSELDDDVAAGRDKDGVLARSSRVEGDLRSVPVSPSDGGARLGVGVVEI